MYVHEASEPEYSNIDVWKSKDLVPKGLMLSRALVDGDSERGLKDQVAAQVECAFEVTCKIERLNVDIRHLFRQ